MGFWVDTSSGNLTPNFTATEINDMTLFFCALVGAQLGLGLAAIGWLWLSSTRTTEVRAKQVRRGRPAIVANFAASPRTLFPTVRFKSRSVAM